MKKRGVLVSVLLLIAAAIWLWQRDGAEPNPSSPQATAARQATGAQRAHARAAVPAAQDGEDDIERQFEDPDYNAPAGPRKLHWLKMKLGAALASYALLDDQLKTLLGIERPTAEELKLLEGVQAEKVRLMTQIEQQRAEVDNFDVTAPPEDRPSTPSGPPITIRSALELKPADWRGFIAQHHPQAESLSSQNLAAIEHELGEIGRTLNDLEIPARQKESVRLAFLPVVDALLEGPKMPDKAAAERMLAARRENFLNQVRGLSVARP